MKKPSLKKLNPIPLNPRVSQTMRRVRQKGTKPEKVLSSELFRRGMRFRVNYKQVPGSPDIAFTKAKVAVFVDGCFWHACPVHGTVPKNNREWWEAKFERNAVRDRKQIKSWRRWGGFRSATGSMMTRRKSQMRSNGSGSSDTTGGMSGPAKDQLKIFGE